MVTVLDTIATGLSESLAELLSAAEMAEADSQVSMSAGADLPA